MESVAATFTISLNFIQKQNPMALDLLSLMSFLDRQGIPKSLLLKDEDPFDFEDAIGMLESFSLIAVNDQRDNYQTHRLVQLITHAWLAEYGKGTANQVSLALQLLATKFPTAKYENWLTCAAYLPHAETVVQYTLEHSSREDSIARAKLLLNSSSYFRSQGKLKDAKAKASESLGLYESTLGPDHADTLSSVNNLAKVFQDCSMYVEAEEMSRRLID